jgi:hypothetical protein
MPDNSILHVIVPRSYVAGYNTYYTRSEAELDAICHVRFCREEMKSASLFVHDVGEAFLWSRPMRPLPEITLPLPVELVTGTVRGVQSKLRPKRSPPRPLPQWPAIRKATQHQHKQEQRQKRRR